MARKLQTLVLIIGIIGMISSAAVAAQDTGTVQGAVALTADGSAVHGAIILIVGPGLVVTTDEVGAFIFEDVLVGTYEILAQREHLSANRETVTIESGRTSIVNFKLELSPVHEEVTVTATTGGQTTTFEAFNATTTLDSFDAVTNPVGTLAEALENQPGIARRSFGAGSGRPIIRGFDGDRVLIMEDGIRTGDLSSQSGDHGVNTDPNGLDRIEVVRGPATLLYGSNAVGGVINAITPHETFKDRLIAGTRGQVSIDSGSANAQAGTFANVQHAQDRLMVWTGGGTRRTGDYVTPVGTVENSGTTLTTGRVGIGYSGDQTFASSGITVEDGRHSVPFADKFHFHNEVDSHEEKLVVDIDSVRRVGRFDVGMRNLNSRAIGSFQVVANVIDWQHDEIEVDSGIENTASVMNNRTYVVRADINQRRLGPVSGRFGVWTQIRNYSATGEEALAPATKQASIAAFAYEEIDLEQYQLQLGGRLERNGYTVGDRTSSNHDVLEEHAHELVPPTVRNRDFIGGSASIGLRADLSPGNALVANLTRSHRAPSLEELYNFGPHVGNLAFEVGNPKLDAESTVGLDLSLRHRSNRLRGDANVYIYDITNFVFLNFEDKLVNGLRVASFRQGNGRFTGFDAKASLRIGSLAWANLGLGLVNAELTTTREALPRIPPLRGQLSVDLPYRGFTLTPEWNFTARQGRVFRNETETAGYTIFNVRASYVWPARHMAHVLSVSAYNLTNALYRNHTSFIKDLAPEIGRGVKVGYSLRFF